ncbi:barstar family protein [Streptomyces sp. NPDC001502]|uniref:barstar family protein n=1 Tax=Streptomyces sp. NPDC001502 TaxID=3364578 RepID=UPI003684C162
MTAPSSPCTFSIHADDDADTHLGHFNDIQGFFVGRAPALAEFDDTAADTDAGQGSWLRPRLIGLAPSRNMDEAWSRGTEAARDLGNVWINVHDALGRTIGSYFAGNATLEDWTAGADGRITATLTVWLSAVPHESAHALWKAWSNQVPVTRNGWTRLPLGRREGWVEVARMHWGRATAPAESRSEYTLDGGDICDLASFYCAIGEMMIGPGGYFGSNLAALDDCLADVSGPTPPFRLVWESSQVAIGSLGGQSTYAAGKSVLDLIVECLEGRGVVVEFA